MEEQQQLQTNPFQQQKRILATSVRGDLVWQMCLPVLEWLIDNGDPEAQARAIQTRAYWEANQQWLIETLNKNRYFELAERAMQNPRLFREVLASLPVATSLQVDYYVEGQEEPRRVDAMAYLALVAAERHHAKFRIRVKRVVGRKKRRGKMP